METETPNATIRAFQQEKQMHESVISIMQEYADKGEIITYDDAFMLYIEHTNN